MRTPTSPRPRGGTLDRLVAILADGEGIREVIAFPKTQSGADLMTRASKALGARQLAELGIAIVVLEGGSVSRRRALLPDSTLLMPDVIQERRRGSFGGQVPLQVEERITELGETLTRPQSEARVTRHNAGVVLSPFVPTNRDAA